MKLNTLQQSFLKSGWIALGLKVESDTKEYRVKVEKKRDWRDVVRGVFKRLTKLV